MEKNCNCNHSFTTEYPCKARACIKSKKPDCTATAVIPSITVESVEGITSLANCFVHVTDINTTFYIDDKHRVMFIWSGPVELSPYDITQNLKHLRSQILYTTIDGVYSEVYFDKQGVAHIIAKEV